MIEALQAIVIFYTSVNQIFEEEPAPHPKWKNLFLKTY